MEVINIEIADIPQLSNRDRKFLLENEKFSDFQSVASDIAQFSEVIASKDEQVINRSLLHEVLTEQYRTQSTSAATKDYISSLAKDNTYTVVTAHQPSLLTGPLYYIFKILSAINLAIQLRGLHPDKNFVPVFVIGSEDHDFEEINHLHLYGQTIEWEENVGGPVGNYPTTNLDKVLDKTIEILGENSKSLPLLNQLKTELSTIETYGDFAFRLTHLLFDHLGLVILKMDHPDLKKAFIPHIKEEIFNQPSRNLVTSTQKEIKENLGLESQAFARDINFFYVDGFSRNRIEKDGAHYKVMGTEKTFTHEELNKEIDSNPERFSPNVVMRPLYQEAILPNLAYIGGGGEIAYWTERKSQFKHFNIPFPMLIRRTSGMILSGSNKKQIDKLDLSIKDLFSPEQSLINALIDNSDSPDYELSIYKSKLDELYKEIKEHVEKIDKTLVKTSESELAKAQKSMDYLESKLKKAIKQKESVNLNRLSKLKKNLFPKGLQERHDNILQYISSYGPNLIDDLLDHCNPFDKKMKVFLIP